MSKKNIPYGLTPICGKCGHFESRAYLAESTISRLRSRLEAAEKVVDAAREAVDLLNDAASGNYKPDSFSAQPLRVALAAHDAAGGKP